MNIKEIKGSTLFVVDDNKENLKVLDQYLSDLGLKVVPLRSGEEILKLIQKRIPDMILLDIMMPEGIDGYETCRRLKANEATKDIPVIFMSALTDTFDKVTGFNLGAVDYITKPIETEELSSRIHTHLSISRLQKELFEMNAKLEEKILVRTEELRKTNLQLRQEINEREQAEEALKDSELRYRTVADFTYDWEYWENPDKSLNYVSPSCEKLSGYFTEQFIKNPRLLDEIVLDEDRDIWKQHTHESMRKTTHNREIQFRIKRKDGVTVWIEHACRPVHDESGAFLGYRASNCDITERKRAEEERQRLYTELKAAYQRLEKQSAILIQTEKMSAMGMMAAGVAHELNNPMMGILNFAQYCSKHTSIEDKRFSVLKDIEQETKRCVSIVQNLLTFSHSRKEKEDEYQKEDFNVIIERVLKLLSYRIRKQNVVVKHNLAEKVPKIFMKADQIQEVILNLLTNALDALEESAKKEIDIEIFPDGEFLQVSVADSGCGIPSENRQNIFDPFYTTKPVGKGTGLGLAIVQGIIKDHRGKITCESEVGSGTRFRILLPKERRKVK